MNTAQGDHPTTYDISQFMQWLGYKWSNDAQIYYETGNYVGHITRRSAEKMYLRIVGKKAFEQEGDHYKVVE